VYNGFWHKGSVLHCISTIRNVRQLFCTCRYDLMRKCWTPEPNDRPTFSECCQHIRNMILLDHSALCSVSHLMACPHCRRKVRLLFHKSETVSLFCDSTVSLLSQSHFCETKVRLSHKSQTVSLLCNSLTFLRQCGQGFTQPRYFCSGTDLMSLLIS